MTITPAAKIPDDLDKNILQVETTVSNNPGVAKFQAVLGALYMKRNDKEKEDIIKAQECFRKAIEISPDHKDSFLAYYERGKFYRIKGLHDKALKDLNKAKEFFGQIHKQNEERVETEINLVEQAMKKKLNKPATSTTPIPHLKSGGANEKVMLPDESFDKILSEDQHFHNVAPNTVFFFSQLVRFLEKEMDSQVNAIPNSHSEIYWKAMALCTKALNQEKEFGMTNQITNLYLQAKESIEQLIGQYNNHKKSPPSMIHYLAASVYFRLNNLEQSTEQMNIAIERNPDGEVNYYRFRALLKDLQAKEMFEQLIDECKSLEQSPQSKTHYEKAMHHSMLDDLEGSLEQIKLAIDTSVGESHLKGEALRLYKQISETFEEAKADEKMALKIDPNPPYYSRVLSEYNQISHCIEFYDQVKLDNTKCDTDTVVKRGENLDPKEVLYHKRAMLGAILGRTDPEKLPLAIKDAEEALSQLSKEDPLYLKTLVGKGQVLSYMKEYEAAVKDYSEAISMAPKLPEFYIERSSIYLQMENYKLALLDLEFAITLYPEIPDELVKRINRVKELSNSLTS